MAKPNVMRARVEGAAELSRALAELGSEATVAGRKTLRMTAKELQAELVAAAPRNPDGATVKSWRLKSGAVGRRNYGQLFQNIRVREAKAKRDNTIVMTVTTGNAFWGMFQEFGTVKMEARPWFRPVWDRMQNRLLGTVTATLGRQIDLAARRIARRGVLPNGRNA